MQGVVLLGGEVGESRQGSELELVLAVRGKVPDLFNVYRVKKGPDLISSCCASKNMVKPNRV